MSGRRVLIVVFDALRPEFVTPELMPHLHRFAAGGVRYRKARSTFPTETRVNQSAVITGCMPHRHGVVGNKFIADDLEPGLLVNSGDDAELSGAMGAGPVLCMPTLGERLASHGLRFAALSAGTPGGGRLINWSAERDGSTRLAMRAPGACVPGDLFDRMVARIGALPEYALPARDWITWAVDAYLEVVEAETRPDVMLLWLCEPDESFHKLGIGSPDARETIAHVDAQFGRVLARLEGEIASGAMQVIALSDHGQVTLEGGNLDLVSRFTEAGFPASATAMAGHDCVVAVDTAGGIWVRDRSADIVEKLAIWLRSQSWCGPLFSRLGLPGTVPLSELRVDHYRAPDLSLVLCNDDAENAYGLPGQSLHDAPYPVGGGCHGGLNEHELHTVLAMSGSAFGQATEITIPGGVVDILPTVFEVLGLEVPSGLDGRVLTEALASPEKPPEPTDRLIRSVPGDGPVTMLSVTDVGHTRYLNRAWVEG